MHICVLVMINTDRLSFKSRHVFHKVHVCQMVIQTPGCDIIFTCDEAQYFTTARREQLVSGHKHKS